MSYYPCRCGRQCGGQYCDPRHPQYIVPQVGLQPPAYQNYPHPQPVQYPQTVQVTQMPPAVVMLPQQGYGCVCGRNCGGMCHPSYAVAPGYGVHPSNHGGHHNNQGYGHGFVGGHGHGHGKH